jgi:predicted nuclease of predicted toxin-antitoxin system
LEAVTRLYLDENLSPKIAEQLKLRGVDAVCVRDLGKLGDSDRATTLGRVLVTSDVDFLRLAADGADHAGIVFGVLDNHTLGDWVKKLELICFVYSPEEFLNHIEYI